MTQSYLVVRIEETEQLDLSIGKLSTCHGAPHKAWELPKFYLSLGLRFLSLSHEIHFILTEYRESFSLVLWN